MGKTPFLCDVVEDGGGDANFGSVENLREEFSLEIGRLGFDLAGCLC